MFFGPVDLVFYSSGLPELLLNVAVRFTGSSKNIIFVFPGSFFHAFWSPGIEKRLLKILFSNSLFFLWLDIGAGDFLGGI